MRRCRSPIDGGLGRLAVLELHLRRHGDLDHVRLAFLLLGKLAAHLLLRHDDFVFRLAHGLGEWGARKLELRLAYRLAPRPLDLAAKHLGDVLFAPGLDDVARDVLARRVSRRDDVADLGLAGLARFLLGLLFWRQPRLLLGWRCCGRRWRRGRARIFGGGSRKAEPRDCRKQTRKTESVLHRLSYAAPSSGLRMGD